MQLSLSLQPRCCAAHPAGTARSQPPSLPPSVGIDSERVSGARVLVVGCVHGAAASAADAAAVITAAQPDALVLELCRRRLETLEAAMRQDAEGDPNCRGKVGGKLGKDERQKRKPSFSRMRTTFGGVGPAVVALLLNAVYDVQRRAGVDPGVEFKSSLRAARGVPRNCRVVCGDADARDTVRALSRTVVHPLRALREVPAGIRFLLRQAFAVPAGGVNILRVLTESQGKRVREFVRVFFPLVCATYVAAFVTANGLGSLQDHFLGTPSSASAVVGREGFNFFSLAGPVSQALLVSYLAIVTLSFVYVLIDERDRILARSIRQAAAELAESGAVEPVIVAVVGLLHVNGCLRYLNGDEDRYSA